MYIVFEGIDNSGKTTQIQLVQKRLQEELQNRYDDLKIITIKEPEIPSETLETNSPNMELILKYSLQRLKLQKTIRENVNNIILSDRSFYSTLAYQQCVDRDYWAKGICNEFYQPNLLFYFVTEPDTAYLDIVQENYNKLFLKHHLETNTYTPREETIKVVHTDLETIEQTTDKIVSEIKQQWEDVFKFHRF